MRKKLHGIGDIHGMIDEMLINLEKAGVVDSNGDWASGDGTLVLVGDLTDRGPHGYEVIRKAFDLKEQAQKAGGNLVVTIGNHDVGFLNCAVFLTRRPKLKAMFDELLTKNEDRKKIFDIYHSDPAKARMTRSANVGAALNICVTYAQGEIPNPLGIDEVDLPDELTEINIFRDQISDMLSNGMNLEDLLRVVEDSDILPWAVGWPAMYEQDGILFQHCDSHRAYKYLEKAAENSEGMPMDKVNYATTMSLLSPSAYPAWKLWGVLTSGRYWEDNKNVIDHHLNYFAPGATKVAHGHTRLFGEYMPMEYAGGKALNLDVGLAYSPHHFGKTGRMVDLTEYKA